MFSGVSDPDRRPPGRIRLEHDAEKCQAAFGIMLYLIVI
jgi:hypothetical protein